MAERVKRGAAAKAKKATGRKLKGTVVEFPRGASAAKGGRKKRGIGDNSGEAPAAVYQGVPDEVWKRHLDKIKSQHGRMEAAKARYQSEQGRYRDLLGEASDDGLNRKAIVEAIKLDGKDHAKVVQDMADTAIALRVMGSDLAPGGQLDLFQAASGQAPPEENPAFLGRKAGKDGQPAENNPYKSGTEEFVVWEQNWRAGQGDLAKGIGKADPAPTIN